MIQDDSKITIKQGSKSFYFATRFISEPLRSKLTYLYSTCREIDDIGDTAHLKNISTDDVHRLLDKRIHDPHVTNFFVENAIPLTLLEELADGVRQDLSKNRYSTFDELYHYCYLVAGTVGRMVTHLFGVHSEDVLKKAEKLGIAMQLTNILRDIEEDLNRDLIFLPKEDLQQFSVEETDITNKLFSENIANLIKTYADKTDALYREGAKGISYLPPDTRLSIRISWYVYSGILEKIRKNNYNPFLGRVYLTTAEKVLRTIKMLVQNT